MSESFPRRLRQLREARGWSVNDLAEQCRGKRGTSRAMLFLLESGDRNPTLPALRALARVFGVSVGELVDGK